MTQQELRNWRISHSFTQEKLGLKLGVTKTCVYRWEAGYRNIPPFLHLALKCMDYEGGELKGKGKKTHKRKEVTK